MKRHNKRRTHFRKRKKWYISQDQWNKFILEFRQMLNRKMQLHEELLNQISQSIKKNEGFIDVKLPKEIALEKERIDEEDLKFLQISI